MAVDILGRHHRGGRPVERGQNACQAHGFRVPTGGRRQDGTMTCLGTQATLLLWRLPPGLWLLPMLSWRPTP